MSESLMNFVLVGLGGFILGSVRWHWFVAGYKKHIQQRASELLDEHITRNQMSRELLRETQRITAAKERTLALTKRKAEELARGPQKFKPPHRSQSFSKQNSLQPHNKNRPYTQQVAKAGLVAKLREMPSKIAKRFDLDNEKTVYPAHTKELIESDPPVAPAGEQGQPPKPSAPLDKPFEHKFYGTQLTVGNFRVVSNLSKGMHRLEIVQNQLYVDNKPYSANFGDVERMKSMIRGGRI